MLHHVLGNPIKENTLERRSSGDAHADNLSQVTTHCQICLICHNLVDHSEGYTMKEITYPCSLWTNYIDHLFIGWWATQTHNLTITQFYIENLVLKKYIYSISICISSSKFSDVLISWNLEKSRDGETNKDYFGDSCHKMPKSRREWNLFSTGRCLWEKMSLICEEQNFIWSYFRWNRRNRRVLCAYQTE